MDPNESLRRIRRQANRVVERLDKSQDAGPLADAAHELAEEVQALDEWLGAGGFMPEAWAGARGEP